MKPIVIKSHTRPLSCVLFNRDGDIVFTSAADGMVFIYYTKDGRILGCISLDEKAITCIDCTHDTKLLLVCTFGRISLFEVETGIFLTEALEHGMVKFTEWCRKPGFQNKFVLACKAFSENPDAIKVYKFENNKFYPIWQTSEYDSPCTTVHWGPFDETLISSHDDGRIKTWNAKTGELIQSFQAHDEQISCINFTDDRLLMISCCSDGIAKLWDTVKYRCLKIYETDRKLNGCDISPLYKAKNENQRQHVILAGGQKSADVTTTSASQGKFQALIHHMIRTEELGRSEGHFGPINSIRFMPDGVGYASAGEDGYLRIYYFDEIYFSDKLK